MKCLPTKTDIPKLGFEHTKSIQNLIPKKTKKEHIFLQLYIWRKVCDTNNSKNTSNLDRPICSIEKEIMHICRNWSLLMEKGLFLLQTKKIKYRSLSSNVNRSNNNHMNKFSNPQNSQSSHHTQLHRNLSKNTTLLVWILFIVSTHNQFTQINTKI